MKTEGVCKQCNKPVMFVGEELCMNCRKKGTRLTVMYWDRQQGKTTQMVNLAMEESLEMNVVILAHNVRAVGHINEMCSSIEASESWWTKFVRKLKKQKRNLTVMSWNSPGIYGRDPDMEGGK